MASKVVISVISIIMVVAVVVGVVGVVHHTSKKDDTKNENKDESLSSSMKTLTALCTPTTFKDACIKSLGSVAQNESTTPQDYIHAGVKLALDQIIKASNLTDTLIPKANATKNAEMTHEAIQSCKGLFDLAVDRLNEAINHVHDPKSYKDDGLVWSIRLWLTDVVTFATTCADEFEEAEAPELHKIMQDGIVNATELTISMLDIVTKFNHVLGSLDLSLNTDKLLEIGTSDNGNVTSGISRRLLGISVDAQGYPTWLSATQRKLLGAKRFKKMKKNKGFGKKKGKGNKGKGKKIRKGVIAGGVAAGGAAAGGAVGVPRGIRPNVVVAQDGSGQFRSIMAALGAHPGKNFQGRYVIYVKAGIYTEEVLVGKQHPNVFMYGDGPTRTVVTGNKSFKRKFVTSKTAPFNVEGIGFFCKDMGFQNTAGFEGHQAVALRVNALQAVFQNCWFDAYQDTLYAQGGSQFFRDCQISGTVDFIFGNGATLIQNSRILVRLPGEDQRNMVTAQGGVAANEPTGLVIQGCEILPDRTLFPQRLQVETYLGRPWKAYAKTVFMETTIGDLIRPEGYYPWTGTVNLDTCFYGEFANRGPGANTATRVAWRHVKVLNRLEAQRYTASIFLAGASWVTATGVPLNPNLA
ncbi:pectinesterase/pectinesterase inhibitor-like [Silene latifolia]|uniref:pectinesterase/pectinesterase inhibitor-like n=1 Tax=Silene latifolia TaxID=37657 RepID=UPI003D779839